MISNIINKDYLTIDHRINIVYTKNKNIAFNDFIKNLFIDSALIDFNETFYGINNPNIVICNDIIEDNLLKCAEICKYFHIPLILIFNNPNDYKTIDADINFSPFVIVSLSNTNNKILLKKYDHIMKFDAYNKKNIFQWKNLILSLCKTTFILKENNYESDRINKI